MKKTYFTGQYKAFFLFALLFSGALFSCEESDKDLVKPKTITDVIKENEQFSTLQEIIVGLKAEDALRTENITLFAPNNIAFSRLQITSSSIIALPRDSAMSFLNYHILGTRKTAADLKAGLVETLDKKRTINVQKGTDTTIVTINRAVIVQKNINADNGLIQVVDRLLIEK
jgi:uncharacterized surface protein with fasciclin (FAS1) repeats